jgi:multiple sugar transport system substrate-binding protein
MNQGITRRTLLRWAPGAGTLAVLGLSAACLPGGTPAPSAAKIAPGTRVEFFGTNTDSIFGATRLQTVLPVIRAWEQQSGITIDNVELGNANYNERLQVLIASDTVPDVVGVGGSSDPIGSLLLTGAVLPLDPFIKRERYDMSDFYPNSMDQYRHRNALWALPMTSNPSAMFVNRDLFARSGVALPPASWKASTWTWNDLLATSRSLTQPGTPEQMVFGTAVADNLKTPTIAVWAHGGDLFDKEFTRCTLDSPQAIEALQFISDLVVRYNVNPNPAQLRVTNLQQLFLTGRLGLHAQGPQLGFARTLNAAKPDFQWGLAALPRAAGGRYALNIGTAYALTKQGKQPDAGWELVKFIAGPEFSRAYMGDGLAAITPRKSVMAEVLKLPDLPFGYKEIVEYGDSLRRMPTIAIPRWNEVSSTISRHYARLWTGEFAVRQVVSDLATEVKPLLEPRQ